MFVKVTGGYADVVNLAYVQHAKVDPLPDGRAAVLFELGGPIALTGFLDPWEFAKYQQLTGCEFPAPPAPPAS